MREGSQRAAERERDEARAGDVPFLPKVAQFLHGSGCAAHACKEDVNAAIA